VLILGASYKPDIDDVRESPSMKLIEIFEDKGAEVSYNDPYIPKFHKMRKYDYDMESVELTPESLAEYDAVVLSTDHACYDYKMIADNARLIVDTRNAFGFRGIKSPNIIKS